MVAATECRLDGAAFSDCASPRSYSALGVGEHVFTVRVSNAAGSSSDVATWTVNVAETARFDIGAFEAGTSSALRDYGQTSGATLWTKPGGTGDCLTRATPGSPAACEAKAGPGDSITFVAGSWELCNFRPTKSGSAAGGYITWRAEKLGDVVLQTTAGCSMPSIFQVPNGTFSGFSTALHHVAWVNLVFDGRRPLTGVQDLGRAVKLPMFTNHVLFAHNIVRYTGAGGFSCRSCDYVTVVDNEFYRTGDTDGNGWSSAINLHCADGHPIMNAYAGFHDIIARNMVSGSYDPYGQSGRTENPEGHTDGNGGVYDCPTGIYPNGYVDVPKTLWVGNVLWQNGGRGLSSLQANDQWYVNNTIVGNGLDPEMGNPPAQVSIRNAKRIRVLNNLVYAPAGRFTFQQLSGSSGSTTDVVYAGNLAYGGSFANLPSSLTTDSAILRLDPQLAGPLPSFADNAQLSAVAPWNIGDGLALVFASPAVDAGVDPRTFMNAEESADFARYGLADVDGGVRPQ
jgi:hypothetical protein